MAPDGVVTVLANGRFMPRCIKRHPDGRECGWQPKHGSRTRVSALAYLASHRSESHRGRTHQDLAEEDADRRRKEPCTCLPPAVYRNGAGAHAAPCARADPCSRCLTWHPDALLCPPNEALHLWNRANQAKAGRRFLAYAILADVEGAMQDPDGVTHQQLGEAVLARLARHQEPLHAG